MESDWKDGFLPHILARGEKYFEEGRVSRIQHCGDTYIATVAGTEDYTVTIDIENNKPRYMECDCPYAADSEHYCKHMAAVLFALECEDISAALALLNDQLQIFRGNLSHMQAQSTATGYILTFHATFPGMGSHRRRDRFFAALAAAPQVHSIRRGIDAAQQKTG